MKKSKDLFWFKCYPEKFLSDFDLQGMTAEERGICFWLWMNLYCNNGRLPYDPESLAKVCATSCELVKQIVSSKFKVQRGFVVSLKVKEVMKDAQSRVDKAVRASKVRWNKQCVSNALASVKHMQVEQSRVEQNRIEKKESKTYCPNSIECELSQFLLNEILKRKPDFKQPNLQTWSKAIDLMLRRDNRKPEQIKKVIQWCQQDDFWQNNILSTEKLRKQFDKLELQMTDKPKTKPEQPKTCFKCKKPADKPFKSKYICPECAGFLARAGKFTTHNGKVISNERLDFGQLEIMIEQGKAKRG